MLPHIGNSRFRCITPGIETLPYSFSLPRHRHLSGYATVVLAGSFEESGYVGRICATAGDVLIHPADCHTNVMVSATVKLIRLDWHDRSGTGGFYRLNEVDALARTVEKDVCEAQPLLEGCLRKKSFPSAGRRDDWPDLLFADLTRDASMRVSEWAEMNGLARETVSRGFAGRAGPGPSLADAGLHTGFWRCASGRLEELSERKVRGALLSRQKRSPTWKYVNA
jgi:hypothetical protein